jgi:uncharacterized SAM-binding protein YcdF (DUF218 family)
VSGVARTTWENATRNAAWLGQHHPGASLPAILLITNPWQLPRASRAFVRQGLLVHPPGPARIGGHGLVSAAGTVLHTT